MKNDTNQLFSVSIAIVATVATLAIGSIVTINAQPSNFTINLNDSTAKSPVMNCTNGKSLTLTDLNRGLTCSNTGPPPAPVIPPTPAPVVTPTTPIIATNLTTAYPTTNSNLTLSQPTASSNLSAAGSSASKAISHYLPPALTQSIIKQTRNTGSELQNAINAFKVSNSFEISSANITAMINTELKKGTIPNNETVLVIYATTTVNPVSWQGVIDTNGNSASQDGSGRAVIPITCDSTMSFQKQEEPGYLALAVVHNGQITNVQLTASPYGVVTATSICFR